MCQFVTPYTSYITGFVSVTNCGDNSDVTFFGVTKIQMEMVTNIKIVLEMKLIVQTDKKIPRRSIRC